MLPVVLLPNANTGIIQSHNGIRYQPQLGCNSKGRRALCLMHYALFGLKLQVLDRKVVENYELRLLLVVLCTRWGLKLKTTSSLL